MNYINSGRQFYQELDEKFYYKLENNFYDFIIYFFYNNPIQSAFEEIRRMNPIFKYSDYERILPKKHKDYFSIYSLNKKS